MDAPTQTGKVSVSDHEGHLGAGDVNFSLRLVRVQQKRNVVLDRYVATWMARPVTR